MDFLKLNIKKIRTSWKMTQEAFAELFTGINRGNISSYEGRSEPDISFMIELEELSGVSIANLYSKEVLTEEISEFPLKKKRSKNKNGEELSIATTRKINYLFAGQQEYFEELEGRIKLLEDLVIVKEEAQ